MQITLCEKCGQAYLKDQGMNGCPQCLQDLLEKVNTVWFDRELEVPVSSTSNEDNSRRRELWELNVHERLERILKRVPATSVMKQELVESVRNIPIKERDEFSTKLKQLLNRLEEHQIWWGKVLHKLNEPPEVSLVKTDDIG